MTVMNDLDRFHLAGDVIDRVPSLRGVAGREKQMLKERLIDHKLYIARYGDDMPEIRDWTWPGKGAPGKGAPGKNEPAKPAPAKSETGEARPIPIQRRS